MIIISETPVRISFFGGGTDYPDFYNRSVGSVLGTTINRHTRISIHTLPGRFFDHKIRIGYSKTEMVKEVEEIEHPSIRECLKFKNIDAPLDIHIFSDLPARTGLGSSSSFTVGFLNALYALQGEKISKERLAKEACFVEQKLIQENVGSQDQFHAAFGGFNIMEFHSSHIAVRPLLISEEKLEAWQNHLMLFYTGVTRHASEILKEQIERTRSNLNDSYLQRIYEMVFEAEDLVKKAPLQEFMERIGKLLHESWELKKQLSARISNPLINSAYEIALNAGAYGGKLCGAGSGGFLMLLAPPEKQQSVRAALKDFQQVPCRFENAGSSLIYVKHD